MRVPLVVVVSLDSATWAALALTLTLIGAALTVVVWRRRGISSGLRALAWTLVPVAAWLTGTLRLTVDVLNDVLAWAARLVFSPSVWLGIVVAGLAAALFVVSGTLRRRGGTTPGPRAVRRHDRRDRHGRTDGDDLSEIEAILKKHGI